MAGGDDQPSGSPTATPEETLEKLEQVKNTENRTLYHAKTVFPFKIFPTEIVVTENSVDIVSYYFFFAKQTFPMLLKDIKNVQASTDIFFSSLKFELSGYETNPPEIKFLPSGSAVQIKRIITGLLVCRQKNIDLSTINPLDVIDKIIEIGTANTTSENV